MRGVRVVERALAGLDVAKRRVQMAGLAGPVARPLGHESRHPAALLREDLGEGLEQGRLVGRPQRIVDPDRGFEHAGAGLRVQALDLEIHLVTEFEQLMIEIRMHAGAQNRIAEEARRDRLEITEALFADGMRRLVEDEELELGRGRNRKAHILRLFQHPPQDAARAGRFRIAVEFREEERQVVLERDQPHGFGKNAGRRVGIGGVPTRQRRVVVELVVGIPAQHHVADAEAACRERTRTCRAPCICRA